MIFSAFPAINTRFFAFLASAILLSSTTQAAELSRLEPAKASPEIIYLDEKGEKHRLDFSQNKLTAVHFWATWCKPCIKELPQVNGAQKYYQNSGLRVIALSVDEAASGKVQRFFAENHIDALAPLFDDDSKNFDKFSTRGLPTTIFVNNRGEVVAYSVGALGWGSAEVENFIENR